MGVISDYNGEQKGMDDLHKAIVEHIPPPNVNRDDAFKMLVTTLDYDDHLGKLLVGRVNSGKVKAGDSIKVLSYDNELLEEGTVTKVLSKKGLTNHIIDSGLAGDIIAIAGFTSNVSSTLCDKSVDEPILA